MLGPGIPLQSGLPPHRVILSEAGHVSRDRRVEGPAVAFAVALHPFHYNIRVPHSRRVFLRLEWDTSAACSSTLKVLPQKSHVIPTV
jgi:hypothetical protein